MAHAVAIRWAIALLPALATGVLAAAAHSTAVAPTVVFAALFAALAAVPIVSARGRVVALPAAARVAGGALSVLALITVVSAAFAGGHGAWSSAAQVLLYAVAFWAFALLGGGRGRVRIVAAGVGAVLTAITLVALAVRLLPRIATVPLGGQTDRISWPLGQWNAVAVVAGLSVLFCFHLAANERVHAAGRVAAAALLPPVALCLLLTSSRGAMACTGLALAVYVIVARPRGVVGATAAAMPTVGAVLLLGYDATEITGYSPTSPAAASEGRHIALLVLGAMAAAAALRTALLPADAALSRVVVSVRARRVAAAAVLVVLVAAAAAAFVVGGGRLDRAVSTFSGDRQPYHPGTVDRFTNFSSNDRLDRWRAAWHAGAAKPLTGAGIDSFDFRGRADRTFGPQTPLEQTSLRDADSAYLQAFAEIGAFGAAALIVAVVALLTGTLVRAAGVDRRLYGAIFAAVVLWGVHAGIDMDWRVPALSLWVFALGGAALSGARASTSTRGARA